MNGGQICKSLLKLLGSGFALSGTDVFDVVLLRLADEGRIREACVASSYAGMALKIAKRNFY